MPPATAKLMPLLINGERVEDAEIVREAETLRQRLQQMTPEQRQAHGFDPAELEKHWWDWSRENVIERVLLRQEAFKDATPISPETLEKAMEEVKSQHGGEQPFRVAYPTDEGLRSDIEARVRLDRLIGRVTAKVAPPKTKEIADYYRKNRERFRVPEMVHAAHIVKNFDEHTDEATARSVIEKVEKELKAGREFGELADEYSDCPGNGGDLGYFPRGQMVEEFEDVVFSLAAGGLSPIFRTVFGFHIAKVYDHRPASQRSLAEAQQEIKEELLRQKHTRAVENYVDRLKAKAEIRDEVAAS